MRELHLFAGAGGGILGGMLLGHACVCAVEINTYCQKVLLQRQRDKILPRFPIWDDIRTFDGRPWRGLVDIVCGGFPCQDISCAGKGKGITGERSGLWSEMARVVCEVRPSYVFVENSPVLTSRGLGRVLGDLATMGYDAKWCVLGASDVGAPHRRKRIWILADANSKRKLQQNRIDQNEREWIGYGGENVPNANLCSGKTGNESTRWQEGANINRRSAESEMGNSNSTGLAQWESIASNDGEKQPTAIGAGWWDSECGLGRVAHGVANRVDRLKAIGNGQVPLVAATAWRILNGL